jgi:Fe-S-cluster containining protein
VIAGDSQLIQILDAAAAEAARLGGAWIVCRPGCMQCCLGPFEITQLDAMRLREGLRRLAASDLARANAVRARALGHRGGDDEPCPALDPSSGMCDLYDARPVTCRVFGLAVRGESGAIGACELNYAGLTDEQIAERAVEVDKEGLELRLLAELEAEGLTGVTDVAAALVIDDIQNGRPDPR